MNKLIHKTITLFLLFIKISRFANIPTAYYDLTKLPWNWSISPQIGECAWN